MRDNPKVTSKFDRSHGKPRAPARITTPGTTASVSGVQRKTTERQGTVAPSVAPKTHHTNRVPLGGHARQVGYPGGGQPWREASYSTTGRHGSDGIHDPTKSTDGAQGQAWSASGGLFGKRSPRK